MLALGTLPGALAEQLRTKLVLSGKVRTTRSQDLFYGLQRRRPSNEKWRSARGDKVLEV